MNALMRLCPFILVTIVLLAGCNSRRERFDLVITGATIVDGTGNPWYRADCGIVGDRITAIGKLDTANAGRVIDAGGRVVAPGFIDMLGQSELSLLVDPRAMSKISQGITTEITGEGNSVAPVNDRIRESMRQWTERYGLEIDWTDLAGYFRTLERRKPAINLGTFVGATQVRRFVIGLDDRAPTEEELAQMKQLVRTAMEQGALGVSTSLIYAPATFARTDEIIELAKEASAFGGIYISHVRDEGNRITEALLEAGDIARVASLPVEIWHLKVAGRQNWGAMASVVNLINRYRRDGLDMTANIYPYPASGTSLSSRIPAWAHDGGVNMLLERLSDPGRRKKIRDEMMGATAGTDNSFAATGPEGILIAGVQSPGLKQYEGMRLSQIARNRNIHPIDALLDLVLEDSARVSAIFFSMNEEDVRMALAQPWVSFCTDGGQRATDGPLSEGKPHPRAYGSFPRILRHYVREAQILTLEEAIRKMTSLPAQRVGLRDRGLLKPGFYADVVMFDPANVTDKATFENPHQYSEGMDLVLVNGVPVWENGRFTGNFPGKPLRGPGFRR
ncbi:MAG: N-acyl-D-amino-acid deacylase [Bacteroidia bacterium]|nr:MAG: N-acyl-D-amino-acid deacylase [Bacteroidia bacterium]